MFFRLHRHCALVEGAKKGAIYNFQSGKVHPINSGALALLKECQTHPVTSLLDLEAATDKPWVDFLQKIIEMDLGTLCFLEPKPNPSASEQTLPPQLEFLWLELTSRCNNRCLHCYADCAPDATDSELMTHEHWLRVIREARQTGASAIQLIGGEPLLYPRWRGLALKAREEGYEFIEIFTNATLITEDDIAFFKEHQLNIATTLYADNADIHDKVTQNPGSFNQTQDAIKALLAAEVPLRIASIIMKANENEADNIMNFCASLGLNAEPPDVIRPTGRGNDRELMPSAYVKPPLKPPFYTDADSFDKAKLYHTCLAGKIAVLANGDVIPCIFARDYSYGNLLSSSLQEILTGKPLTECWHTTKDQIDKCKDCEFRYACPDCRPLAQGSDPAKNWLASSPGCSYNPYQGRWEE